jgi:O-succinylbenzoate synthase
MARTIIQASLTHLQVALKAPQAIGDGSRTSLRDSILVALETRDGRVGVGECAPPPDVGDPAAAIAGCWDDLAGRLLPGLLGRAVESIDDIQSAIRLDDGRACHPSAVAGAETACWDLVGQAHKIGLAALLGASEARIAMGVEPSVRLGVLPTVVDLLRAIEPHRSEGVRAFVVSITPGSDLEFVSAARDHCAECLIAVDAGGHFGRSDAVLFRELDALDPLWIERPYAPDDVDGLVALQKELITPICLDATHAEAIRRGACRMARLEIQRAGGLGPALRLHDFCRDHNVGCRVETTPELGVGLAQAIALASLPNCKDPSGLAPAARWFLDDIVKPPIELDDDDLAGRFRVSLRPGLGHVVDWSRVQPHQVRQETWGAGRC